MPRSMPRSRKSCRSDGREFHHSAPPPAHFRRKCPNGKIMIDTIPSHLPRHVAIIMDGNGRWARKRHLPREAGHVAGVAAVRQTVRAAVDLGLENLTLFAFSSENWKRPKTEVGALMGLFRAYFKSDMDELVDKGCRVRIIGHRGRVADDIHGMIEEAEKRSVNNKGLNLT